MAHGNEPFARLKRLLIDHGVTVMMAGDTHDLEYYVEPARPRSGRPLLRQRWRRRVPEPRHRARVAR